MGRRDVYQRGMRKERNKRKGSGYIITVGAGTNSRWKEEWRNGIERAVVYVTTVGEAKKGSGGVC